MDRVQGIGRVVNIVHHRIIIAIFTTIVGGKVLAQDEAEDEK